MKKIFMKTKKMVMVAMMVFAVLVSAAMADPVFTGTTGFNLAVTEQGDVFPRKLYNVTTRFDGTITMNPNSGNPNFPIVTMAGRATDGTNITVSCPADWDHMAGVSALADNTKKTANDKWKLIAGCSFAADDGSGTVLSGVVFLTLTGTLTRPKGWMQDYPESVKITGAKIIGGVTDDPLNVFVFSGTFSSTLTPSQTPQ